MTKAPSQEAEAVAVYTIPQVAALLSVSRQTVYTLIGSGDLNPIDISTSGSSRPRMRITATEVNRFTASRHIARIA